MEKYSIKTRAQLSELTMNSAFRDDVQKKGKIVILKDNDDGFTTLSASLLYPEILSLFEFLYKCMEREGKSAKEVYEIKMQQIKEKEQLEKQKKLVLKNSKIQSFDSEKEKIKEELEGILSKMRTSKRPNIKIKEPVKSLRKKSDIENAEFILSMSILRQRVKRLYYDPKDEGYNELIKQIDEIYFKMRNHVAEETFFELMYFLIREQKELCYGIKDAYRIEKFSDEDILNIIKEDIGQENFKTHCNLYLKALEKRCNLIKKLEEQNFITREEIKVNAPESMFYNIYKEKRQAYILKYCNPEDILKLYKERDEKEKRYINSDTVLASTTLQDILISRALSKEEKLKFLTTKKRYDKETATGLILGQYVSGYWTLEELRTLISFGYLSYAGILELYNYIGNRQILAELNEDISEDDEYTGRQIKDEKMIEIFSPEVVLNENLKPCLAVEEIFFYEITLKRIYKKQGRDLEKDIITCINEQNKDDKHTRDITLIELYYQKVLSKENIQLAEISEETFIEYYKLHKSNISILINFYNDGLISNFAVIEELEEDKEAVLNLVQKGLDLGVLQGFCTTGEIIELIRQQKINLSDLYKLKEDIDLEEIRNLYMSSSLNYAELYILADNGAISKEDADEINEDFDLQEAVWKLQQRGIRGKKIGGQIESSRETSQIINPTTKRKITDRIPRGLSPILKGELFDVLGGTIDVIEFNEDHPFYGCVLIPVLDKKIGIIEGNGRTCVVPLKIAIEYVENPGSEDDIFGNATRRNDVYLNKKYVSSINHVKNWGINLIKKVVERSSVLNPGDTKKIIQEANQRIVNGKPLLEALQESYEDRKKDINRN